MKKTSFLLLILFLVTGVIYYSLFNNVSSTGNSIKENSVKIIRVIDGDTIEIEGGEKIRLLGVNTPEKKEFYANQAIEFTKQLENQTIKVKIFEKDKYGRNLGYVFFKNKNFNEELLKYGYAHFYSYSDDKYTKQLKKAELLARENQLGIWKESENIGCLKLIELKYKEDGKRCTNRERIILQNSCKILNVTIKDDATHLFKERIPNGIFEKNFSCVFNDAGDSLFIWDETGLLLFERYT
jgi:endonuclease YncB( thermonuclease family)